MRDSGQPVPAELEALIDAKRASSHSEKLDVRANKILVENSLAEQRALVLEQKASKRRRAEEFRAKWTTTESAT